MDSIFKALSDPGRRQLLDSLRKHDGQTSSELEASLPHLSRFGVMKHLKILEEALLVTSRKEGRFKYHYLNTVPIQQIADRWISRFATPWAQGMIDLQNELERGSKQMAKHVFTHFIQTSVDQLWDALTTPEITQKYFFGLRLDTDWQVGSDIHYFNDEDAAMVTGKVLEYQAKSKIVYSFKGDKNEQGEVEPDSRVTFEIEPMGTVCKLTLIHDEFPYENTTYNNVGNGWPIVLSGLKTLMETGKPLEVESGPCESE